MRLELVGAGNSLGMATPGRELAFLVPERDSRVGERLSDCMTGTAAVSSRFSQSQKVWVRRDWVAGCLLLSQTAVAWILSPTLPPLLRYVTVSERIMFAVSLAFGEWKLWSRRRGEGQCSPFRSVETPVAYKPMEATASEPPRSTMLAMVPPCRIFRRFWEDPGCQGVAGTKVYGETGRLQCGPW